MTKTDRTSEGTEDTTQLTLHMHSELAETFDHCFSPGDAASAFDHLYEQLPRLHRNREAAAHVRRRLPFIRIYHAYLDWYPIGVTYVQVGHSLIVIDVWHDDDPRFSRRFDHKLVNADC